jgi:hypothetical protein
VEEVLGSGPDQRTEPSWRLEPTIACYRPPHTLVDAYLFTSAEAKGHIDDGTVTRLVEEYVEAPIARVNERTPITLIENSPVPEQCQLAGVPPSSTLASIASAAQSRRVVQDLTIRLVRFGSGGDGAALFLVYEGY